MSFPVYVLDLGGVATIGFPDDKADLDHFDFWETTVARIVAHHYHLPLKEMLNLPYCQRRARISSNVVYFGERQTKKLLRQIEKAVGTTGLRFAHDEHEKRLELTCWSSRPCSPRLADGVEVQITECVYFFSTWPVGGCVVESS